MKTDELVTLLAQSGPAQKPLALWWVLSIFFAACAVATFLTIGLRPELQAGIAPLGFWIKTGLLLSFAAIAAFLLHESSLPKLFVSPKILVASFAAVMTALIIREWVLVHSSIILDPALTKNFLSCFTSVSLYGAIGAITLTRYMRKFATLDTNHTAGLIGLAAASTGAVGYSFHCPIDSPTFIVTAYGTPMAMIWALSRKYLAKQLEW